MAGKSLDTLGIYVSTYWVCFVEGENKYLSALRNAAIQD